MFKKCKVVMLSTNEKAIIGDLALSHNNVLNFAKNEDWLVIYNPIKQHIYITSDEEIKENSLVLLPNNTIHRMNASDMISYLDSQSKSTKLIISTTQQFMNLSQPSQQFIEKYIKEYNLRNIIANVLVEYEFDNEGHTDNPGWHNQKLKVNSKDNTITIKKIKDSYSREEVIELISDWTRMKSGLNINLPDNFDNWIETNL